MKFMNRTISALCIISTICGSLGNALIPLNTQAANPYLPLWEHIPDGEPHVFEDPDNPGKYRIYIYGSHDILKTEYCGVEQVVWSAPVENPTEWEYEGVSFKYYNESLGKNEILYAPDVCEVKNEDGTKTYYLYPNNMGGSKLVAKSDRPEGPFEVCSTSCELGGDPAVFVDEDGQAYGYWGFETSYCGKLDPKTGHVTDTVTFPLGGCNQSDDKNDELFDNEFRFYEASSMRKILGKYVYIYSRKTRDGEDGLPASNSTLAYAYGDSPMGPFTYGGTIIDSRAKNTAADGETVITAYPNGNTHGSIENVNGQWYVFYHRQTNNNEVCRQGMAEPVSIRLEGERLIIDEAEVTSQGFEINGLNPKKVTAAGNSCYLTGKEDTNRPYVYATYDGKSEINNPVINIRNGSVVGFKYFNFDGIGNDLMLEASFLPMGTEGTVSVMLDSPYEGIGTKISEFTIAASDIRKINVYRSELQITGKLSGKHALYFVFKSESDKKICKFYNFVFTSGESVLTPETGNGSYFGKINRSKWTASATVEDGNDTAEKAFDDDVYSRYSTGALMRGGEEYILDMGEEWTFNKLALKSDGDHARGYNIYVSNDNVNYVKVKSGEGTANDNPYQVIEFDTQRARYIKLEQTADMDGKDFVYWSIYDLNVYYSDPKPIGKEGWSAVDPNPWWNTEFAFDENEDETDCWTSYEQTGKSFTIDMAYSREFDKMVMYCKNDYPRGYRLEVSNDGDTYTAIASGEGSVDGNGYMSVKFDKQNARYFRIVQTAESDHWWSVFEIYLYDTDKDKESPTPAPPQDLADFMGTSSDMGNGTFRNPVIYADSPDPDIVRVGDTYYMVSTTMHMAPGVPIYCSYDLVNWETVNYVYAQLEEDDARALKNNKNDYANGSWASSLRYDKYEKRFYVCFTCETTGKTYIFSTADIENGPWHRSEFTDLKCYDNGLLFVDNGTGIDKYDIYVNTIDDDGSKFGEEYIGTRYAEVWAVPLYVDADTHDVTHGEPVMLLHQANFEEIPTGLKGEGYHSYKIGDYYYIMMIQGEGGQAEEIIWRKKTLDGNDVEGLEASDDTVVRNGWECKKIFIGDIIDTDGNMPLRSDSGIAQGCIVDTPEGDWYSMLFQTTGAVGRIPVLIPVKWENDWPVLGNNGKSINEYYEKPVQGKERKSIVVSDDFTNGEKRHYYSDTETEGITAGITAEELCGLSSETASARIAENEYGYNGSNLKKEWQWNHNPNNNLWSLTDRTGYLRLKAGIITDSIQQARNTLTQRVYGPNSSAYTVLETDGLKEGDIAGISSFQNQYGYVGITVKDGKKYIVMNRAQQINDKYGKDMELIPFEGNRIYLGVNCELEDKVDQSVFCYSLDGENWKQIGDTLMMSYDWPHFVGYRFGLFCYPTESIGGYADFDSFNVSDKLIDAESNRILEGAYYAMDSTSPLLGKKIVGGVDSEKDTDTNVQYTTGFDGTADGAVKIDAEHGIKLDIDPLKSAYGYTVSYRVKMTSAEHDYNAPQLYIAGDNQWSWVGVLPDAMWCSFDRWGEREMKLDQWQTITLTVSKKRIASIYVDGELLASKSMTATEGVNSEAYIYFGVNKWTNDKNISFSLDDVYVYTDELNAEQVKAVSQGNAPGNVDGLTGNEFEITVDNGTYSVNIPKALKENVLYVAQYNEDGTLYKLSTSETGAAERKTIRAYLWNESMKPVCCEAKKR